MGADPSLSIPYILLDSLICNNPSYFTILSCFRNCIFYFFFFWHIFGNIYPDNKISDWLKWASNTGQTIYWYASNVLKFFSPLSRINWSSRKTLSYVWVVGHLPACMSVLWCTSGPLIPNLFEYGGMVTTGNSVYLETHVCL